VGALRFIVAPGFFPRGTKVSFAFGWIYLICFFLYFCVLVNSLLRKLPAGHDINIGLFRFNIIFPLVYIIVMAFIGGDVTYQLNHNIYGPWIFVLLPFHLYATYCCFYLMWFVAKAIATVEAGKVVNSDAYLGTLLGAFLFPIGIWWVHPKVRRIFGVEESPLVETSGGT
jgi:hypothetical protein